jgi:hypothetical protein
VSANVIKRKRKCREQRCYYAQRIQPEISRLYHADHHGDPSHCQSHGGYALQRRLLQSARNGIEQDPDWRRVLHDDRGGDICSLNCQIVEKIGRCHTQSSQQEDSTYIGARQLQLPPTAIQNQDR